MSAAIPPPLSPQRPLVTDRGRLDHSLLRFPREEFFFAKLQPQLGEARKADLKLENKIESEAEKFFQFLCHAVDIDQVGSMPTVISTVKEKLATELPVHVFLTEFPTATAMCVPRFSIAEEPAIDELIVLVSQHFIGHLNDAERASVLGHELGHALLEHSTVPREAILDGEIDLSKIPELRSNILRWSICCEVSCDMFGYVASGGLTRACQTALLKFSTGLDSATFQNLNPDAVVHQVLQQFDTLAGSVVKSVISTHPLTPLRLRLLQEMEGVELLRLFGSRLPDADIHRLRADLNQSLSPLVRSIYPELFEDHQIEQGFILFYLGVATALADGNIDRDEINVINQIISPGLDTKPFFDGLENSLRESEPGPIIDELVGRAVSEARERAYTKAEATRVTKDILTVAAADGRVDAQELKTIYHFAQHFGLSKHEIVYLANQVNRTPA